MKARRRAPLTRRLLPWSWVLLPFAVFNVITRQGSDRFQSDASDYAPISNLTSQPVLLPVPGMQSLSGYERIRYRAQGDQHILLESRGSRRLSSQSLLDVPVSRTIHTRRLGRIDLLADLLNALNDKAEEELASDNMFSSNFRQPTVFMDPRRALLGARLNFK